MPPRMLIINADGRAGRDLTCYVITVAVAVEAATSGLGGIAVSLDGGRRAIRRKAHPGGRRAKDVGRGLYRSAHAVARSHRLCAPGLTGRRGAMAIPGSALSR